MMALAKFERFEHLFGWLLFILAPVFTARLVVQTTCLVARWAQLAWLARALNGRKLAGATCAGDLGKPTVQILG